MAAYKLRETVRQDYKQLNDVHIPRIKPSKREEDKLYPVEIVDRADDGRVKVHYIGFSDRYDEWKDNDDIVPNEAAGEQRVPVYKPFDLHCELAYQIKVSLDSRNHRDPDVRIDLPFDSVIFNGGLEERGRYLHTIRNHDVYTIDKYSDLASFLGFNWHIRGLNDRLDFCYVNLDLVQFYLHKRKSIVDFCDKGKSIFDGGDLLVFRFVRMDGVKQQWEQVSMVQ